MNEGKEKTLQKNRAFRRAKRLLEFVIQCTYTSNSLLMSEYHEVVISIEMLLISLFKACNAIYGSEA